MRFEIFPRRTWRGRRWFFRAIARNGEPVLQSESYHNRGDAEDAVTMIRTEAATAPVDIEP